MNIVQKILAKLDALQQSHPIFSFPFAVVKKYGEDHGSYQSALITYYGFLSLFPLLIVFTSLTQLLLNGNPDLQHRVAESVNNYIPLIGSQIQNGIHDTHKTGLALVLSLLVTIYGARGGANALQWALSSVWHVPLTKQPNFIKNASRSLGIIVGGGIGLVGATVLSSYLAIFGHGAIVRIVAAIFSTLILWGTFIIVFKLAIAGDKKHHQVATGALISAIGLQVLQVAGSAVLAHQLKNLSSTYGTFALVLGILFWINLQAQMILYAAEVDVVKENKLYPRSLQDPLTPEDKKTMRRSAKAQKQHDGEDIKVGFTRPHK